MKKVFFKAMLFLIFCSPAAIAQRSRFLELWNEIHNPANGYFSPEGVPYYACETCVVDVVDYGHETTSAEFSSWIMLDIMYANITGTLTPFTKAWNKMEQCIIPSDQPGNDLYNPQDPSIYAVEGDALQEYPARLSFDFPVGSDPVSAALKAAYGDKVYALHRLLDSDDFYGYGAGKRPVYIDTFRRGVRESVWETIPHPAIDDFTRGGVNGMGFEPLFSRNRNYTPQWRYTSAPGAEADIIRALYRGYAGGLELAAYITRAAQMGDWIRLSFFDEYFNPTGTSTNSTTGGTGYDSCHYLISREWSWGGNLAGAWAFRTGGSYCPVDQQNPLAAWICSGQSSAGQAFTGKAENAARDWQTSLGRQLGFYQWLQSGSGLFGAGAVSSWKGRYAKPPAGQAVFIDMYYAPENTAWFGLQARAAEKLAEYYYVTGDVRVKHILDQWAGFCKANIIVVPGSAFRIPETVAFSGQPGAGPGLKASVVSRNNDAGVAATLARSLYYYGQKSNDPASAELAHNLMDIIWTVYRDGKGIRSPVPRPDYSRFLNQDVFVPAGMYGNMGNGDPIRPGVKFIDIRSKYRQDACFNTEILPALDAGAVPVPAYHRFRDQVEAALTYLAFDYKPKNTPTAAPTPTPTLKGTFSPTPAPSGDFTVFTSRDSYTVTVNSSFVTNILVNTGSAALAAYGMSITYDPDAIRAVQIAHGDYNIPPIYNIENPGIIYAAGFDTAGKFGTNLLKITWKAGAHASMSLNNIDIDTLADFQYNAIGLTGRGAVVLVIPNAIGDVNEDGSITVADALTAARYTAGLSTAAPGGDADCNGVINIVDVLLIAQYAAGLAIRLGCLE